MAFFSFSIPKAIQRAADGGRSRRPYHVYEIRITPSGVSGSTAGNESWCVYRRYNEFYRLHRRLQKQYPTVKKLDFPPKKKFGNLVRDWGRACCRFFPHLTIVSSGASSKSELSVSGIDSNSNRLRN